MVRTTPGTWYWSRSRSYEESELVRIVRFAESYLPAGPAEAPPRGPVRASVGTFVRLLGPDPLFRVHAAQLRGRARRLGPDDELHLWLHPHNLGASPTRCIGRLREVLAGCLEAAPAATRSVTMGELAAVA